MKVNINTTDVELKYSFRSLMFYEKINGETFAPKGLNEMIMFFYSTVVSSNYNINLDFEDFVEWLDENPEKLTEFSEWLMKIMTRNNKFTEEKETENVDVETKKK